jgi:glutamate N-acetyltransferase/amino-acid N-acetyltransferase
MMKRRSYQVQGFRFSGIAAGIKDSKTLDLALIESEVPAVVVGSFTTSKVQAAPVQVSKKNIRSGLCSAVIINSGNANACTGAAGLKHARAMTSRTAALLKLPENQVLVSSTGKIGIPMPIDRVLGKIPEAVRRLSPANLVKSAQAILTTDDSVKLARAEGEIFGKPYKIVGFAKGAGMIEPHMAVPHASSTSRDLHATMLAYIMTDAFVPRSVLHRLFKNCVAETFNRVSVDGDMSTNDTALVLANGLAGNKPFRLRTPACRGFAENLYNVMESLAKQMVFDGEGATKCVKIVVRNARNDKEAEKLAYVVANSLLVKTSFFGQDPNWGRVFGAAGRAGVAFQPEKTDVFYDKVCVARKGSSTGALKDREAKKVMKKQEFTVTIDCKIGRGHFFVYTSDLTLDYVKLNSCYRT